MKLHTSLSDRIGAKKYSMVMNILNNNKELDVTYNEGEFFIVAIKNNSVDIVKALLDYFKYNQLENPDNNRIEDMSKTDQLLITKICNILDVATQDIKLSQKMKEVLSPYIDFEGSEHNTLNDSFSDIDQTTFIQNVDKDATSNNFLNEEVLKKFEAEQNSQTKIIENLLGFGTEEIHPQIEEHNTTTNVALSGNNIQEVH
jgi:hypothetical protein